MKMKKGRGSREQGTGWGRLVLALVVAVAMATGAQAETIDVTQANIEQYRTLQNGNTYRFVEDVTFTAGSSASALKVANSATVTLEILSCATVTLKGGDASGTTGAGAGIEVPSGSKLTIKGEGRIFATGGNAANGGNGGAGGTGLIDREYDNYRSGAGGNGGNGGGGAGAGIGGHGGNGGGGGSGGSVARVSSKGSSAAGNSGTKGGGGTNGGACGDVEVSGPVSVIPRGGAGGAAGKGGAGGEWGVDDGPNWYVGFGGGGGGGGGAGLAASDIGGGAGIGSGRGVNDGGVRCGTVTINGGRVMAQGGAAGAGIGGGIMGAGGTVTINGGRVTARGRDGGKGIGGGFTGAGGTVTINGGTVEADGWNGQGLGGAVTIDGGSVKTKVIPKQPKNGVGKDVYCVTVELSEELRARSEELRVEGLDGYGKKDIYPIDGRVYLYLPDGTHRFTISDGATTLDYCAIVKGRGVTVEPLPPRGEVGFFVNGRDVGGDNDSTMGWSYDNDVLTLSQKRDYVLSGAALENEVQIKVAAEDARVILSNAVVITSGRAALEVGKSASLLMAGDASYLAATNGAPAVTVAADATLTVDLGDGGDRLESMIGVFGFGEENAIGGVGAVEVKGGTLVALADAPAVGVKTFTCDDKSELMAVGDNPENARFASSAGTSKYVLVAPFCRVLVPIEIPGVRSCVVTDTTEPIAPSETVNATNVYKVMVLDDVTVEFTAEEGYEIVGGASVTIPRITGDVTFGSADLPAPDVRRNLAVTLPEVEGLSFVVTEGGEEVKVEGEGEGTRIYSVRSGYDVEIVCMAKEGWRIVSETNVVRFANISESKVLTAANLPQVGRLFTVTIPQMEGVYPTLTSTDEGQVETDYDVYSVLSNAEVTVTFHAFDGYRITANGEKTWTITGDVTFDETEGFPLPTVEHAWPEDPEEVAGIPAGDVYWISPDAKLAEADACKIATWAKGNSVSAAAFMDDPDAYEQAFLFNCAADDAAVEAERAAYKITEFRQNADGEWEVTVLTENTKGDPYNGISVIECFSDAACTTPVEENDPAALFIRASLQVLPAGDVPPDHGIVVPGPVKIVPVE